MPTTEQGHHANRMYVDQDGNIHLNGASLYTDESGTTLSGTEIAYLDGLTAGTVTASKAVVVDSNKDIGDFRNLDCTNLDAGASGTAGSVDIFPATASKGKLTLACTNQTGDTAVTINANAMGQATTLNIKDPANATSYLMQTLGSTTFKVAAGQLTTATATDTVVTGLATVVAVVATLDADPGDDPLLVSATIGDQAGAPAAGSVIIKTWKTNGTDPTPIAASTFSKKVNWLAIGT